MNCACRTKSLRIFVQTLTELRVTDPIISRSVRLNRLGSLIAFRQTSPHHPTRLFSSSTATYFPRQKWSDDADDNLSASKDEEGQFRTSTSTAADTNNDQSTLIPSASDNDLTTAKINGTIFEYSPESIDTLVASLDRTSIAGEHSNVYSDAQSRSRLRPKPPITSSQLKRRKIIKEDKLQPSPEEEQRAGRDPGAAFAFPEQYTTEVLARHFEVSPDAVRRILKSKWTPSPDEETSRQERWFNRGKNIWGQMAELGKKPPSRWRREGVVRKPHWNEKKGPRTEYPYVPRREENKPSVQSAQRKLSGNLL
ncbi:hypothetical protein E0Z10_g5618 [Xylaria hypoxylon]|uniref:Required for respiratory growth protein 9, mitochondrial n=1 Tax=Xylaria hypoxylon TaxID=37992 RepID=A0A4Z0Z3F1_9PEZI|nr:hypothetical protein E0Z10_g5618 [Xylaria hypoxylon]